MLIYQRVMFFFGGWNVMVEWDLMRILWWVNGTGIIGFYWVLMGIFHENHPILMMLFFDQCCSPISSNFVLLFINIATQIWIIPGKIPKVSPRVSRLVGNSLTSTRNLEMSKMVWRMDFPTSDIVKFGYFWSCLASSWLLVWNLVMRYITTISQNNL